MRLNKIRVFFLCSVWCLLMPSTAAGVTDSCPPFFLRTDKGEIINPISGENADQPFSTRATCGACHDVERISKGWHFNMDWDRADDGRFKNTRTPWRVSTGLTGSMTTYGYYFLAKKKNTHPDQIDLTAFDFVARSPGNKNGFQKPGCAACHPGGGMLEFDRDGQRYDRRLAENPGLARTLDGDYYNSQWDKTGVIEPDCFICHSGRYHIQTRIIQMKDLNFKWAGVAAAGIGQVHGRVSDGDTPKVVYNKRLFNEDGRFYMPDMVFRPRAKNCLICHESIELGKRGMSWDDPLSPDVHHLAGLTCIDCHTGDIDHNMAKGNANANTVADELDNTMRTCKDCHSTGYRGATRLKHTGIRKDHLDKLSCEACHIPELARSAVGAMVVATGRFGKIGQLDTKRFGEHKPWKPAYIIRKKDKDNIARITPVNPYYASLFTNRDKDGVFYPLFLSEMEKAYETCRDRLSKRETPQDFHNPEDIRIMLETLDKTLAGNKRFNRVNPYFHDGGRLYSLDETGAVVSADDSTWVADIPYFSISHNVAPREKALGSNGCRDCHSDTSHLFNGRVVTDFFGTAGRPETVSMTEFMGLPTAVEKWNRFFSAYLNLMPVFFSIVIGVLCAAGGIGYARRLRTPATKPAGTGLVLPSGIVLALGAAHLFITRDFGLLVKWSETAYVSAGIPILLLVWAAAGFVRFARRGIQNRIGLVCVLAAGALTAATGVVLWFFPVLQPDILLPVWGIHAGLALVIVCIGGYLIVNSIVSGKWK